MIALNLDRGHDADVTTDISIARTHHHLVPDADAVFTVVLGDQRIVRVDCTGRVLVDTSAVGSAVQKQANSRSCSRGPAEHFDRARAVLECIGKVVVHCAPVGVGQIAKACNHLVVDDDTPVGHEALVLAQGSGLDPWRVRGRLGVNAASPVLQIQASRMLWHD